MDLRINGELWKLYMISPDDPILRVDDGYTLGVTIPAWHRIYVNKQLYGDMLKSVLAHEIAHAEFASRGLIVPVYTEEVLADIISDNILDTFIQMNNVCRYYGRC